MGCMHHGVHAVQVSPVQWDGFYKPLWLASAFLNSGYSYYWDLERDWDIQAFTASSGMTCWPFVQPDICLL